LDSYAIPPYVTSIEEVLWGAFLIALTMALHGGGVIVALRASDVLRWKKPGRPPFAASLRVLLVATWILVIVHLLEVLGWAAFFWLRDAFGNASIAFYYALMQYTTVSSEYRLPDALRLLGGMIAMSGLLTFAWSTSVLLILAQGLQDLARRPSGS
jgi:hypothetical protein